jgi:membrane-associated phospholipid phosphatase
MKTLRAIIAGNRLFFAFWGLFFVVGLLFFLWVGKGPSFVELNPYHQTTLDIIFQWITWLGDGWFSVIVIVYFLVRRRWSKAAQLLTAFLLSAIFAQLLKRAFSMPRPWEFFPRGVYPHFIEGITRRGFASFPSGHTTSVFALATLLALFTPNQRHKIGYLFAGVLVGYSRIYLGQHFLNDVIVGSIVGMVTAVLVHWLFLAKLSTLPVFARE